MKALRRRPRPDLNVGRGEKLLAWAESDQGVVGGTRDALYLPADGGTRVPWEQVEAADWDLDAGVLRVTEVGEWGVPRPEHLLTLTEPALLLQLVRERVTASVVLQRHVAIAGKRGVRVIARRAPHGDRPVAWFFEYDQGVDPEDPAVREASDAALAQARSEVDPG